MSYADEARERVRELKARGHAVILAVESSCDETAMALVADGRRVLSGEIASQVDTHALYGGVVPEIASRMHVEALDPLLDRMLAEAGLGMDAIDAVGVTFGPGLVGALLTDQRFHQGAEQLFGLRLTRRCRRRLRCGRGGLGLANRFGDGFLHVYESAARRVRRTALCVRGCHAARRRFCLCGMLFRIRTDPCLALLRGGGLGAFRFRALSFLFAQTLLGFHLPSCFFSPLGAQSFTRLGFRGKVCGGTLRRLAVKARLFLPLEAEALLLFAPQIRRHKVVTDRARNDNQQGQCRRADNRQNQQNPQNRLRRKRAEKSLPRKQERIGAVVVISPVVPPFRLYHRFKGENQCRNRNGKIDPSLPVAEQSGKPHPNR